MPQDTTIRNISPADGMIIETHIPSAEDALKAACDEFVKLTRPEGLPEDDIQAGENHDVQARLACILALPRLSNTLTRELAELGVPPQQTAGVLFNRARAAQMKAQAARKGKVVMPTKRIVTPH